MEAEERSVLSETSLAGLPASDPLRGSSRPHMKERTIPIRIAAPADNKSAAGTKKRIQISVKKLREVAPPCHPERSRLIHDETTNIPPALWANKSVSRESTVATSGSVAEGMFRTPAVLSFPRFSRHYFLSSCLSFIRRSRDKA